VCGQEQSGWYDRKRRWVRDLSCADTRVYLELDIRRVDCKGCGAVKRERLEFISDNPLYSKRFGYWVGRRCREMTVKAVAEESHLDWHTVKELDKQYMQEQLNRAGKAKPACIGIDEVSIRKRHVYRIVVSDLDKHRPIWFGGNDRSEASMDLFYDFLGKKQAAKLRIAVMDMWKPFRHSAQRHAPQAAIIFDKFHVLRHLSDALDTVRKQEYSRLEGRDRTFIKGQKYALLSNAENLKGDARTNLKRLLRANKRLNTAYLLKESFAQLWDYKNEAWARKFFDAWCDQLKWQRLEPFEKFAKMIDQHWRGIAAYCQPENKVALGYVEGLNNKIRVLQRRAYGLRDEGYLKLKILTCALPAI
jgi:transposase